MILVLAGTADGRKLAATIQSNGYKVLVSTATDYGSSLTGDVPARSGALDEEGFVSLVQAQGVRVLVDASHPFAVNLSQNAMAACARTGLDYVRYERKRIDLVENHLLYRVGSYTAAAELAGELGECIFLATGSNSLEVFVDKLPGKRLIARVLPMRKVLDRCLTLGIAPKDIVAMQGPFGYDLNQAMLKHYGAEVLVTKESGEQGGTDLKIKAALDLGIPVVMLERPQLVYPVLVEDWPGLNAYFQQQGITPENI